ncbi:MAG TPA: tetratricopeptide repeat protein [Candidatus Sulfotelmatobacter sp.]|nr:tetratricopeptide repeat protein [Candidatus Sulfotelmatobacter sp.]
MERPARMGANKQFAAVVLMVASAAIGARAQDSAPADPPGPAPKQTAQPPETPAQDSSAATAGKTSSTQTIHEKTGPNSSRTIRHTRVLEQGSQPPELTQAEDSIQKRDYSTAESLLRKVVEHDPANYVAWFDLGFLENAGGRIDESIAAYRKSVEAKPDVFESNLNLGLQLAKTDQPDAEKFLSAATQLRPTSHVAEGQARAWLSLARVLEKTKPDEAIAAYGQAAALRPSDPEPHLAAGLLLEKENKFSDAETEYKQALARDATSEALTGLANIYMRGRRFVEAEEYLRKLVSAQPGSAAAHVQLGRVLAAEGKNDAAVAELEDGVKLAPADASVQRDLADTYLAAGKNEEAEAAYRALLASHADDADLHRSFGQALLREKKFPDAQHEFLTAVKLKPDFGEAYGDLAFAASENKNYPLVIKALDARTKLLPDVPSTYFLRASAFDHLRDMKLAAANYHLFLNTANGKYPDQEWQAKHRLIAIEPKK